MSREYYSITVIGEDESIKEFEKIMENKHPKNLTFKVSVDEKSEIEKKDDGQYKIDFSGYVKWSIQEGFFNDFITSYYDDSNLSKTIYDNPLIEKEKLTTTESKEKILSELFNLKDLLEKLEEQELSNMTKETIYSILENREINLESEASLGFEKILLKKEPPSEIKRKLEQRGNSGINILDISKVLGLNIVLYGTYDEEFCSEEIQIRKGEVTSRTIRVDSEEDIKNFYYECHSEDEEERNYGLQQVQYALERQMEFLMELQLKEETKK